MKFKCSLFCLHFVCNSPARIAPRLPFSVMGAVYIDEFTGDAPMCVRSSFWLDDKFPRCCRVVGLS